MKYGIISLITLGLLGCDLPTQEQDDFQSMSVLDANTAIIQKCNAEFAKLGFETVTECVGDLLGKYSANNANIVTFSNDDLLNAVNSK